MMEVETGVMHLQPKEHQGVPATTGTWEESGTDSPPQISEEACPVDTLISDFRPPDLWDNTFLLS